LDEIAYALTREGEKMYEFFLPSNVIQFFSTFFAVKRYSIIFNMAEINFKQWPRNRSLSD
jgi:hypothetical protein